MIKIKSKTYYFAIKKSLWAALRYFCEKDVNSTKIYCIPESFEYKPFEVIFNYNKLKKELGDFRGNFEDLINESRPKGKLYHKKDIVRIFENSSSIT